MFNEYDHFSYANITKEDFLYFPKLDEHEKFPKIVYKRFDLELIHALLYHFYWADFSKFKHMFRLFPPKPDVPLFTLSCKIFNILHIFSYYRNHC